MLSFLIFAFLARAAADDILWNGMMSQKEKKILFVLYSIVAILIIFAIAFLIWKNAKNQAAPPAQRQRLVPNNQHRFTKNEGQMMPQGIPMFQPVPMPQYYQTPQGFAVNPPPPMPPQQDWPLSQVSYET